MVRRSFSNYSDPFSDRFVCVRVCVHVCVRARACAIVFVLSGIGFTVRGCCWIPCLVVAGVEARMHGSQYQSYHVPMH
jgi:hypothetical protein